MNLPRFPRAIIVRTLLVSMYEELAPVGIRHCGEVLI
jgi:hypothetical protein